MLTLPQTPDWQTPEALTAVQGPAPLARPQKPLLPQTPPAHWVAEVQATPRPAPQVWLAPLQRPAAQTAAAASQAPSCKPSLGMAAPAASLATQPSAP